jgi:undecaprenyl-phosphate 4-deoxy-4-formamido-L-arabinose transferase
LSDLSLSVVVPVFNSEATLEELSERIEAALRSDHRVGSWELILVNDGSRDESWERIVALNGEHPDVRGLDLARNFGQHNALLAGIHTARGEVIVTIDDDLQNRPEEIPRLLAALTPDVDIVYGKPVAKRRTLYRRVATRVVRTAVVLGMGRISLDIGGFRAFRASLLEGVGPDQGDRLALDTLLARTARRHAVVRVQHEPRRHGSSNYTFGMLVGHTLTELRSLMPGSGAGSSPSYVVRRTAGTAN